MTHVLPREAMFYEPLPDGHVRCTLCPRSCTIADGHTGVCGVRANQGGRLVALTWGRPSAVHVDPIEKKPLFHFLPGSTILSLGTVGCNMTCRFCQNWDLTRTPIRDATVVDLPPDRVVDLARSEGCPSIAFTYNEPTIFAEYVIDVSVAARAAGLRTVMVTNGYISPGALQAVYPWIDAANVDLKAFHEDFYREHGGDLKTVLESLAAIQALGVWLEVTTLLIPGLNDSPEEVRAEAAWLRENLGPGVPLHFSAFHPDYRMQDRPRTPPATLHRARAIAQEAGLKYVYEGNVLSEGSNTWCPACGRLVIERSWNELVAFRLDSQNRCPCGEVVPLVR